MSQEIISPEPQPWRGPPYFEGEIRIDTRVPHQDPTRTHLQNSYARYQVRGDTYGAVVRQLRDIADLLTKQLSATTEQTMDAHHRMAVDQFLAEKAAE